MATVSQILHIAPGNLDAKKNMKKFSGCGDGYGDAAYGGDYVCSYFVCVWKPRWRKIGLRNGRSVVCATMQESESKQVGKEAEVGFYTLFSLLY